MRWKRDQVCTTVLKAREISVQECNSVKSTCNSTLPFSLGFAPKLTVMLTVAEKSCLAHVLSSARVLTNNLEHGCAIDQHGTDVQILVKVSRTFVTF